MPVFSLSDKHTKYAQFWFGHSYPLNYTMAQRFSILEVENCLDLTTQFWLTYHTDGLEVFFLTEMYIVTIGAVVIALCLHCAEGLKH